MVLVRAIRLACRHPILMSPITRGFGRKRPLEAASAERLPPGQYLVDDFPVLSAGPTPRVALEDWRFTVTGVDGLELSWSWEDMLGLPSEEITVDIHCVTKWSKLDTRWRGVSMDAFVGEDVDAGAFALFTSHGGYTTNVPVAEVTGGRAWVAYEYEGAPLSAEHGGPARLLIPHLYLWKSAKWVNGVILTNHERRGFWESYGYHNHGDPWREQRYSGD